MFRFLKKCIVYTGLLWAFSLLALQLPFIHNMLIQTIEKQATFLIGAPVHITSVNGLFPLYISLNDVFIGEKEKPLFHAQSVQAIPAWPDLLLGHVAFYHLGIHSPELQPTDDPITIENLTQKIPLHISLYSYSFHHVPLDPFVKGSLDKPYFIKGRFFYNPKKMRVRSSFKLYSEKETGVYGNVQGYLRISETLATAKISSTLKQKEGEKSHSFVTEMNLSSQALPKLLWHNSKDPTLSFAKGTLNGHIFLHDSLVPVTYETTFNWKNFESLSLDITSISSKEYSFKGPLHIDYNKNSLVAKTALATVNGIVISHLQSESTIEKQDSLYRGKMSLSAKLANLPLKAYVTFSSDLSSNLSFPEFSLSLGKTNLQGNLDFLFSPFLVSGTVQGASNSLSDCSVITGKTVYGKASLSSSFSIRKDQVVPLQEITTTLHLEKVTNKTLSISEGSALITGCGTFSDMSLTCNIQAKKCSFKHFEFDTLSLSTNFSSSALWSASFDTSCSGKIDTGPFSLNAAGSIEPNSITLSDLFLSINNHKGHLKTAFRAYRTPESYEILPFEMDWDGEKGNLQGFLKASNSLLATEFHAKNVPLDPLHFFFPETLCTGTFSGDCSAKYEANSLALHGTISSDSLSFASASTGAIETPFQASFQIDANTSTAEIRGEVTTDQKKPLEVFLKIPLELSYTPVKIGISHFSPLKGTIKGDIDIAPLFLPLLDEDERVEGTFSSNIIVGGTYAFPQYSGKLSCRRGKLDMLVTGGLLSDISFDGNFQGNIFIIDSCTATDEKEGKATLKGSIELSPSKSFPFHSEITSNKMEVIRRDFSTVKGTGAITFSGDFHEAFLKGSAVVDQAELNIKSDLSKDIADIDISFVEDYIETAEQKNKPFTLTFDLDIDLPQSRGTIVGRGLTSFWQGKMNLSGPQYALKGKGRIFSQKGFFLFGGKEFILKPSSIDFAGNLFSESRMNIHAYYDLGAFEAELILRDSFDKPRLSFTSSNGLSEREILSWIIFGKPLTDVSPLESLQLANLLVDANPETKFNIIEKLKERLGIDIDVTKSESKSPLDSSDAVTVQVSKYVTQELILKLSKDVANAVNRVGVQANVRKNISIQAEVGDDREGNVSVKWKKDY